MNELSFSAKVWSADDGSEGVQHESSFDVRDAAAFREYLRAAPSTSPAQDSGSSPLGEILQAATHNLLGHEQRFNRALKRFAQTGDPLEGLEIQRRLSDMHLSHGLAVKVIGKTTQALETLTRLQ